MDIKFRFKQILLCSKVRGEQNDAKKIFVDSITSLLILIALLFFLWIGYAHSGMILKAVRLYMEMCNIKGEQ